MGFLLLLAWIVGMYALVMALSRPDGGVEEEVRDRSADHRSPISKRPRTVVTRKSQVSEEVVSRSHVQRKPAAVRSARRGQN